MSRERNRTVRTESFKQSSKKEERREEENLKSESAETFAEASGAVTGAGAAEPWTSGGAGASRCGAKPGLEPERAAELGLIKQQILKKFGRGSVFSYDEESAPDEKSVYDPVSTGILSLDSALGIGGLPSGRIIELYGPESSGKTTLTLNIIANFQKRGKMAAFIDAEHALDINYAKKIGVDLSKLLISQPASGEECFDICGELVKSGVISLIVIDSVAAIVPRAEIEAVSGEIQVGLHARLMASALRRLTSLAANNSCSIIFINQLRDKIGSMFGGSETTPGGRALKFFSSVRMEVRKIETIKNGDSPVGIRIRAKIIKNKCAMPFRHAELELLFNDGISYESDLINIAIDRGIIEKSGAWYSLGDEKIGQGKDNIRLLIKEAGPLRDEIEKKVKAAICA